MRATSTLTKMGAAAREQLRGASAVDSRTDEPRRRALHGQHSRANARETEQMSGDSPSGGAHFSMCTFDRAGCKDGSVLAAGGAAIRGSSGRSSEYYDRVPDRNSFATKSSGRTFVMYHGTTWRNWQRIIQHGCPRAIIRRTMMRQPRWLYHEPPCVVRWCGSLVLCSGQAIAMRCDAGSTCSERLRRWGSWGYR